MFSQSLTLPNPPSIVEYKSLKFLIMDAPSTRLKYIFICKYMNYKIYCLLNIYIFIIIEFYIIS